MVASDVKGNVVNNNFFEERRMTIGRRRFLRMAGAASALTLAHWALADERETQRKSYPALGTFPAGVAGDTAFVGITVPLTGPYSSDGKDQQYGNELAIEHLNHGGGLVKKIPTLSGRGVLGKRLTYKVADSQTQPNTAVEAQTRFIHQNQAIVMAGGLSSAVSVALEKLAQREFVVYMIGGSGSNDTTGKDCQRYGFRSQPSAYMAAKALAPVVVKALGSKRKAAYLIPDYTYGHTVFDSTSEFTGKLGWTIAAKQVVPVGTTDFSPYLVNIANSGADVFVNVTFGLDAVASSKQAKEFGVLDKMKMVVPNISPFQAAQVGAEIMQGVYGTLDFWWTLAERNEAARIFVDSFATKYHYKPRWTAHIAYTQMLVWADAVERAGTFYPPPVIKALEDGHRLEMPLGPVYYRACDHQQVRAVPVVVGKQPSAMRNQEDFFEVVDLVAGESVLPPCDLFGCKLGPYA
jgi:ABC-type branched-subunit amino acid transport system substrate-binding protein